MPYAPTVNDNSGQILAQGINQGVGALFGGIKEAMQKREEKRKQDEAFAFLRALPDTQGVDDKSLKAGINSMGAGAAWQVTQQMAEQKRGEEKRALDMEVQQTAHQLSQQHLAALGEQAAQQQRNQAAMRGAFNPTTGTAQAIQGGADFANLPGPTAMDAEQALRYMGAQGADPATMQHYSQTIENMATAKQRGATTPEFMPRVVDMGDGVKGMTTSRSSAVPINTSKEPLTDVGKLIQDRDNAKTPEDRAKFVQAIEVTRAGFVDKPYTVNEFIMAQELINKFDGDYGKYRQWDKKQRDSLQKVPPPAGAAAGPERVRVKLSDLK